MRQRRVYLGSFDKRGNLIQVGYMTARQFQQSVNSLQGQKISLTMYRAFIRKQQVQVLQEQAA